MNDRLKSLLATVVINGAVFYALIMGLAMSIQKQAPDKMTLVNIPPERLPPPKPPNLLPPPADLVPATAGVDWANKSPALRNQAFMTITKWVKENMVSEEEKRLERWRQTLPQGSGPGKVTRLRPANLATHTLYWPAQWSKGLLPIVAWGNGHAGMCANSSLPYAAFLSEIASWGYFVVAVGNDDIDYPQPEGLRILADGRPVETQASALKAAVDWAIAENDRVGSPYYGRIDTSKVAYMGHGCGAQQAMTNAFDPRATTTIVLNAPARLHAGAPDAAHKVSLAQFSGSRDDGTVLDVADANFSAAAAAGWPMVKAALVGMGRDGAYAGPDRRWSRAVLAWLDLELKGRSESASVLNGLARAGWNRAGATGVALLDSTDVKATRVVLPGSDGPALAVPTGAAAAHAAGVRAFSQVPGGQVQVVPEGDVYVLRDLIADNPLYTFDKDEPGKSNCTGACASTWTPLAAGNDAEPVGKWTIVKREGGSTQWAYDGKPVYSFSRDPEPVTTARGVGSFHRLPTFPIQ